MAGDTLLRQGETRRADMVTFIREFRASHPYGPTIQEVAEAVGLGSPNATRHHLQRLKDEGRITYELGVGRSIDAVPEPPVQPETLTLDEVKAKRWPKATRFIAVRPEPKKKKAEALVTSS